jgi:DNA-binding NarL/FixJ family response regulator
LLQACGGDVAAEAGDGQEAVEKIQELSPELAVLGATLPILDGVEVARQTQRRSPHVRVLLILDGVAEDVAGTLASGAIGCLSLDADAAELRRAIQMVMRGDRFASPRFLTALPPSAPLGGQPVPPHERAPEPLSPREREVLHLAANGLRNQEIARRLSVSVKTVEAHKAHIMRKLRLRGPADLIKYAIRAGLVDLGERGQPSEAFSRGRAGFTEM